MSVTTPTRSSKDRHLTVVTDVDVTHSSGTQTPEKET
jgi:hypothetical protein